MFNHPFHEDFFPNIQPKPLQAQLEAVSSCPCFSAATRSLPRIYINHPGGEAALKICKYRFKWNSDLILVLIQILFDR